MPMLVESLLIFLTLLASFRLAFFPNFLLDSQTTFFFFGWASQRWLLYENQKFLNSFEKSGCCRRIQLLLTSGVFLYFLLLLSYYTFYFLQFLSLCSITILSLLSLTTLSHYFLSLISLTTFSIYFISLLSHYFISLLISPLLLQLYKGRGSNWLIIQAIY